jgi:lysophospholipase L1-like esterase
MASDPTPTPEDLLDRPPPGRRGMPAGRALVVLLVTLLLWALLYAPELKRSAEAHPVGTRRSISLAILSPLAWLSDTLGLTGVTDQAARVAGRNPDAQVGGGIDDSDVEPLPPPSSHHTRPPRPPPVRDTPIRDPSGARPLRVVVVGDSLAQGIGYYAERVFKPYFVDVNRQGRISTGLARPDYFDWPAQMQLIVDRFRPDLTIVLIGENDNQSLLTRGGDVEQPIGQPAWPVGYETRVEQFARIASSQGGHVMWVGLPIVRDTGRWTFLERQNGIYEVVADRLPNVGYFDSWDLFANREGDYTAYYRDGDRVRLVRADDGVHFNSDGYTILMRAIVRSAIDGFGLDPKTLQ